jgi:hypothetical protein
MTEEYENATFTAQEIQDMSPSHALDVALQLDLVNIHGHNPHETVIQILLNYYGLTPVNQN